jgi:hypothetical protein
MVCSFNFTEYITEATSSSGLAACTSCPAGTYSSVLGATTCTVCPAGSTSPINSDNAFDCDSLQCNTGFTKKGKVCVQCEPGKYKSNAGTEPCVDCQVGTHSLIPGGVDVSSCVLCTAGTFAASGASVCEKCSSGSFSTIKSTVKANSIFTNGPGIRKRQYNQVFCRFNAPNDGHLISWSASFAGECSTQAV